MIDGCDKDARKRGMCLTHYPRWQRWMHAAGTFEPIRIAAPVIELEDGRKAKRCTKCEVVKLLEFFYRHDNCAGGRAANCIDCVEEWHAEYRAGKGKASRKKSANRLLARNKRRNRAAEKKYDEWATSRQRVLVPAAPVLSWVSHVTDTEAEAFSGIPSRTFYSMREREHVDIQTADAIARAFDRTFELARLVPPHGVDGWSEAGHRYCGDHPCLWKGGGCGTIWHQHKALGLCVNCHQAYLRELRTGKPATTLRKKRYGT